MTIMTWQFIRRLLRGVSAFLALIVLLVGVPIALSVVVGWPLPHALPTWSQALEQLTQSGIRDATLVSVLAIVCWLAWAELSAAVAVEVIAVVRGKAAVRVPMAGPVQLLAAHLVATMVLAFLAAGNSHDASVPRPPLLVTVTTLKTSSSHGVHELSRAVGTASTTPVRGFRETSAPVVVPRRYIVQRRDTLWGIDEAKLGDPFRWPEVFQLNRGRPQPDGRALSESHWIYAGWVLDLPGDVVTVPPVPARAPSSSPLTPAATTPTESPGVPVTSPATPIPSPTSACLPPAAASNGHPQSAATEPDGAPSHPSESVELPSGAVVGLGLAAAISTAVAAARLHQRRRRIPGQRQQADAVTGLATETVRRLRRAHLTSLENGTANRGDGGGPTHASWGTSSVAAAVTTVPGRLPLGEANGRTVTVELSELGGLGLNGAGAADAARALLVTFLTHAVGDQAEAILVNASPTLVDLVDVPRLDLVPDLGTALDRLEVELIQRTRLLGTDDADGINALRLRHPGEPLPAMLLVAETPDHEHQGRLMTVLGLGSRLGISAVLNGSWPSGVTATVSSGGSVESLTPTGALTELVGGRMFTVSPQEASDLLAVVAAARGVEGGAAVEDETPAVEQAGDTAVLFDSSAVVERQNPASMAEEPSSSRPVMVSAFGPLRIEVGGHEITKGLRSKARELLAFLLLHPRGVTPEIAVDTLWPDAEPGRGIEYFRTATGNLRCALRAATTLPEAMFMDWRGERYQLDKGLMDADIWRLQAALKDAALGGDEGLKRRALEQVGAAYKGEFLEGAQYEWAEAAREDLRRQVVDALTTLAELRARADDLDSAIAAFDEAIRIDPFAEELYRRVMRLEARCERPDAVRRTYRLLETQLAELDVDPDEETVALLNALTGRSVVDLRGKTRLRTRR